MTTDLPPASRRDFLRTSAAAAVCAPFASTATVPLLSSAKKKILVLGGTAFLGPAVVEAALRKGHEITLFNRGRTNPEMFPDVEKLRGNRRHPKTDQDPAQDLSALEGRKWDAVVDTSGYYTRNVEDTARLLADAVDLYVFVSSISVYRDLGKNADPLDEASPLAECENKYALSMGEQFARYGALKAYCEQAVEAALPGRATLVRPGYIVGPRDRSDRFTYWPLRVARGGTILAPGAQEAEQQFIDVRDLGEWIIKSCEDRTTGPFNAVGFKGRISTAEFLHTGKGTLNHECDFEWVDDAFLVENGITSWGDMPCWAPQDEFNHSSNEAAIAAGLTFRPIAETIRDTWQWAKLARAKGLRSGLSAEREAKLLENWRKR